MMPHLLEMNQWMQNQSLLNQCLKKTREKGINQKQRVIKPNGRMMDLLCPKKKIL
uniref:Alternative protein RBBP6 n=1 Tax=Homo sapiens TaxID=9606 RepID=L8E7X2_HUMAN|nr:alternative protein RBBP6 [Homo sapiens]